MADRTAIEWTDATWNPIRARNRETGKVGWFCVHASEGCRHCYAEGINHRLGTGVDFKAQNLGQVELFLDEDMLLQPLRWKRPRRIFVGSMTDLFGDFVPDEMIERIWAVMALAERHTFQVLTKRPDRMRTFFEGIPEAPKDPSMRWAMIEGEAQNIHEARTGEDPCMWLAVHGPLPNVWVGISAEDQTTADQRLPHLFWTPAARRFLSAEPLLGPMDIDWALTRDRLEMAASFLRRGHFSPGGETLRPLDQVIVGGESGPRARPISAAWVRTIRDACARHGAAFFFKQWGEYLPGEVYAQDGFGGLARHQDGTDGAHRGKPDVWWSGDAFGGLISTRVGKKAAGRLLDGREHNGMLGE